MRFHALASCDVFDAFAQVFAGKIRAIGWRLSEEEFRQIDQASRGL